MSPLTTSAFDLPDRLAAKAVHLLVQIHRNANVIRHDMHPLADLKDEPGPLE